MSEADWKNMDQWEIHLLQGYGHTLGAATGLFIFLDALPSLVGGVLVSFLINLWWETPKMSKDADDRKDFVQRCIGASLAILTWSILVWIKK